MTLEEKRRAYQTFFLKNEAGKAFIASVNDLIEDTHKAAESLPELSRDYVQRAKGMREVLQHINSLTAERKTTRTVKS